MCFSTRCNAAFRSTVASWVRLMILAFALIAISTTPARAQNLIIVSSAGSCTLAQAIGFANQANGVDAASIGSATTSFGSCQSIPPIDPETMLPPTGPYQLDVQDTQVTLTSIDNYWYGPNALPPIASSISIVPLSGTLRLIAAHAGDPAPTTAHAFRFFYVSGGLEIQAGSLTLTNTLLQGGYARGGGSRGGGGGAGLGGAIFNQGSLALANVSLIGNTAHGGDIDPASTANGGGGMGEDATGIDGAGFGGSLGGNFGGSGGSGSTFGGGGGGGFIAGSDGQNATPTAAGPGGGKGGLGGPAGLAYDGGFGGIGNGGNIGGTGGAFGNGGQKSFGGGGGGGVGGGGGSGNGSGAGGFGGGGGSFQTTGGGFGGGSGSLGSACGGFGAACPNTDDGSGGSGGAGMGGAIFNHTGTVELLNVIATGNAAIGGSGYPGSSGLGAVVFNLNGNVTIDFSTLAGNFLSGDNGRATYGSENGTVYSLAFGNKIQDGSASIAKLTINSSIIHGTHSDGAAGTNNDVLVNVVDGTQANVSSVKYVGKNFVQFSTNLGTVTQTGSSPTQADPLLGALSLYRASPLLLPVLPIGNNSPATDAASNCLQADGLTTVTSDARGTARPQGAHCDVGAYEFDGDYIFAANFEQAL